MKRVTQLGALPAGLADYLANGPAAPDWETFRDYRGGAAYRELIGALERVQRGLCAYCEIGLAPIDREIEHFHPKSDHGSGIDWTFRLDNLFAACTGGSRRWHWEPSRFLPPIPENLSCGAAKGECVLDGSVLKPSELPASPPLFRVVASGAIQADPDACRSSGMDVTLAQNTIDRLRLDCLRLTNARAEVWRKLEDDWLAEVARTAGEHASDDDFETAMHRLAPGHLLPDPDGRLAPFFTTVRMFFGAIGEDVLAASPDAWA